MRWHFVIVSQMDDRRLLGGFELVSLGCCLPRARWGANGGRPVGEIELASTALRASLMASPMQLSRHVSCQSHRYRGGDDERPLPVRTYC